MSITIDADKAFFTSDLHFYHKSAAIHRGFGSKIAGISEEDVVAHNNTLIQNINDKVPSNATLIFLGDFCLTGNFAKMEAIVHKIRCNILIVPGNHDEHAFTRAQMKKLFIGNYRDIEQIKVRDSVDEAGEEVIQRIVCCHFPLLTWNRAHHGAWHLHGHSHGNLNHPFPTMRVMDVGVDTNNLKPYSYAEIKSVMMKREYVKLDHHKEM